MNRSGKKIKGIIHAPNSSVARVQLHRQGITLYRIHHKIGFWLFFSQKITSKTTHQFIRQLTILLNAQTPLVKSLEIISKNFNNPIMRSIIQAIMHDVRSGLSLATALRQHPQSFNAMACNLIEAGEQTGTLSLFMSKLTQYHHKMVELEKNIQQALIYPTVLFSMTCLMTWGLLMFVVPEFETIFNHFNAELPFLTQVLMSLSKSMINHSISIIGFTIALIAFLYYTLKRSVRIADALAHYQLRIPVFGYFYRQMILTRLSHTLAITLSAGLPVVDALTITANVITHRVFHHALLSTRNHVKQGLALHRAMAQNDCFPHVMVQMISTGEETGLLGSMCQSIATQHDDELQHALLTCTQLLEPLLMLALGMVIGGIILAVYLPIFNLGTLL